jgi:hypothetical protein
MSARKPSISQQLAKLAQAAPAPQTSSEAAEILHCAAMFALAEAVADLAGWVREALEADRADWKQERAAGGKQ